MHSDKISSATPTILLATQASNPADAQEQDKSGNAEAGAILRRGRSRTPLVGDTFTRMTRISTRCIVTNIAQRDRLILQR